MADFVNVTQDLHDDETTYLPAEDRSFYAMFFQNGDGFTAGELNLMQQIIRRTIGQLGVAISRPGFSFQSPVTPGVDQVTIGRSFALGDDIVLEVASSDPSQQIVVDAGPPPTAGLRTDFVYLEMYLAAVGPTGAIGADTDVLAYGGVANATLPNDIKAPEVPDEETTRRVQMRWRIKTVPNVDFTFNPTGFISPQVVAQGNTAGPVAGYSFVDMGVSEKQEYSGLWRAGHGTRADSVALGTADGYVYALAMLKITRHAAQRQINSEDIAELRQVTNADLLGVFNFNRDCSLLVKALPVRFFNCDGTQEEARVTPSLVDPTVTALAGIVAANQLQSTVPTGTAPLTVASTTTVANLSAQFLQNYAPGTGKNSLLALDALGNAAIDGVMTRVTGRATNALYDRVALANEFGTLWLLRNASWDGAQFSQNDATAPSGAIKIDAHGATTICYAAAGAGPGPSATFGWQPILTIDSANEQTILTTPLTLPSGSEDGLLFSGPATPALASVNNTLIATVNATTTDGTTFTPLDITRDAMAITLGGPNPDGQGHGLVFQHCPIGGTFAVIGRFSGDGALDLRQTTLPVASVDGLVVFDGTSSNVAGLGDVLKQSRKGVWRPVWASADNPPGTPSPFDDEFDYKTPFFDRTAPPGAWSARNPRGGQTYAQTVASTLCLRPGGVDHTNVVTGLVSANPPGNYHTGSQIHGIEQPIPQDTPQGSYRIVAKMNIRLDAVVDPSATSSNVGNAVVTESGIYVAYGDHIVTLSLFKMWNATLAMPVLSVGCDSWYTALQWEGSLVNWHPSSPVPLTERTGLPWYGHTAILEVGYSTLDTTPDGMKYLRFRISEVADGAETTGMLVAKIPVSFLGGALPTTFGLFAGGQAAAAIGSPYSGFVCDYVRKISDNGFVIGGPGGTDGSGYTNPDPPTNVQTATTPGSALVAVTWTPPLFTGLAPLSGYQVYRAIVSYGSGQAAPSSYVQIGGGGGLIQGTQYNDTDTVFGNTYSYEIRAVNSQSLVSAPSIPSPIAYPIGLPGTPNQPQLAIVPGAAASNLSGIAVTWAAPTQSNGAMITGYTLYRTDLIPVGSQQTQQPPVKLNSTLLPATQTTYTDVYALVGGHHYAYTVSASNAVGEGAQSQSNSIIEPNPIIPPTAPTNVFAVGGFDHVDLSWGQPIATGGSPITGYKLYRAVPGGALALYQTLGATQLSYQDAAVIDNQPYTYTLSALTQYWEGPQSESHTATPIAVPVHNRPSPPQSVTAVAGVATIQLAWQPPADNGGDPITTYNIYSGNGVIASSVGPATLSQGMASLTNGQPYSYYITARNANGESQASAIVGATPSGLPGKPPPPTLTPGSAQIATAWSAPVDTGGVPILSYDLQRGTTIIHTTSASPPETSWTDTGLVNGTTYYYTIRAHNANGTGPWSDAAASAPVSPVGPPRTAPRLPAIGNRGTNTVFAWTAPADDGGSAILGYKLTANGVFLSNYGWNLPQEPGYTTFGPLGLSCGTQLTLIQDSGTPPGYPGWYFYWHTLSAGENVGYFAPATGSYTFTVTATNAYGDGPAATFSGTVT
jgi:hypothetical protein